MTSSMHSKTRILILGGGFAGINALLSLEKLFARDKSVEIMMVSDENFFLFTPMLSEVAIGAVDPRHIVTPIREVCRKAEFRRANVVNIDLDHQAVDVRYNNLETCPDTLTYDHLILAMGSDTNVMLVPGVDKYAFNFKEIGDALLLRNHILEMFERADSLLDPAQRRAMLTFSVIGGGYSGVEVAAAIQEMAIRIEPLYPSINLADIRIILVEAQDRILSHLPKDLSDYAHEELEELGIEVMVNTRVDDVQPDAIVIQSGPKIPSFTTIWATGIVVPPLIMGLPVKKDRKGRPLGSHELQLSGYKNVWGIGDNILTPLPDESGFYPATAQIAVRQGQHVAKNLYRVIKEDKYPEAFSYQQKGEMVVLGERSAVAVIYGIKIKGFPAWVLWRLYYLSQLPRAKKKGRVATDWILNLFGPFETTQLKAHERPELAHLQDLACRREVPVQKEETVFSKNPP